MASSAETARPDPSPDEQNVVREILGYLNFSGGKPDAAFQRNLNEIHRRLDEQRPWPALRSVLEQTLGELQETVPAFADSQQAAAVISLVFDECLPAYRRHHADLLFHLPEEEIEQPFFLARAFEAVLSQGAPWEETERITPAALDRLNDFLGYRPIAVLENGRRMQPYPHERFRPVPLYIRDAGVAWGKYHDLIERTLMLLRETPQEILAEAYFDYSQLDELALDVRAHDHLHPVNKRTNYLFGEWDPHQIDLQGRYRRFVLRKIILDALLSWMEEQQSVATDERLYDAAAVLSGTILMASSISGGGPETHNSTVTLTSLLPKVARQRDAFYDQLLQTAKGTRARRLKDLAKLTRQPFGHVRQALNMYLAQYGSQQVQRRHLAYLYARMGFADAARDEASVIPSLAARFESEVQWRITALHLQLGNGKLEDADRLLAEMEDFLRRGIECGAFVDPWNILGFQAQFPLFSSREDSVPDQRVETLLQTIEQIFDAYSRSIAESAAQGQDQLAQTLTHRFHVLAEFWDRFGAAAIEDLPEISGQESWESASHVARALAEWRGAGEAGGDVNFWRQHVERFSSAKAYAQVIEVLLDKHDHVASMALLMQWLDQAEEVGLETGPHSIFELVLRWMDTVVESSRAGEQDPWVFVRRLFDHLEANAGEFWSVPALEEATDSLDADSGQDGGEGIFGEEEEEEEGAEELFGAAYEGVIFRDSAQDGQIGDTFEGGYGPGIVEFEYIERYLEPRLKFLRMLAQLWQTAATVFVTGSEEAPDPQRVEAVRQWERHIRELQSGLTRLLQGVAAHSIDEPSGDHDSNVEYDLQFQTKLYLQQMLIATHISCQSAQWALLCCLPDDVHEGVDEDEKLIISVYRGIFRRDVDEVRKLLPRLLQKFARKPLLYVPLDHGGDAIQVKDARTLQAVIRFLVTHLPRLGLLRETWHLLRTAQRMEQSFRPRGVAVTEFDRLFRGALRNSLETVVTASRRWRSGKFTDEDLIEVVGEIIEHYLDLWLEHSNTMRLSTVEALKFESVWQEIKEFIEQYGGDLFHARLLTLGNVRAILHSGVDRFLDHLAEEEDPLHPIRLLDALEKGDIDEEEAIRDLELIYGTVVDKFDRFLEYNTTTTQSDYGEKFYSLLDFLRREVAYDRDAWNLLPVSIAHEVLARERKVEAARIWKEVFEAKTHDMAEHHLKELGKLEKTYGMRLPSITDHLNERFVKPLTVDSMVALIPEAIEDARQGRLPSSAFERLRDAIEEYLQGTTGSGLDVPPWLRQLEGEVHQFDLADDEQGNDTEPELKLPPAQLNLREMQRQLTTWRAPLAQRKKPKK